jgi:hypothetical protein
LDHSETPCAGNYSREVLEPVVILKGMEEWAFSAKSMGEGRFLSSGAPKSYDFESMREHFRDLLPRVGRIC